MNIKFSQLPTLSGLSATDIFPILHDGVNYVAPVSAIYTFLSGDMLVDVATSYMSNSSYYDQAFSLATSVYSTVSANSGNYVLDGSNEVANWNVTYNIVQIRKNDWDSAATFTKNTSSKNLVVSDTTLVPNSTAINNIIAISLADYNNISVPDPNTFYVITS